MFHAKQTKADLIQWIKAYFEPADKDCKAVIGISGGKDSSVAAALCAEALGRERVYGVLMPQGVQSDFDVAERLARHLGTPYTVVNIGAAVDGLLGAIPLAVNAQARYNTPPRVRMTVLYAVSASVNGRVVNTSNLSEDWVGWATKFGDTAGDFSPLSMLTATEVVAVGEALGLPAEFTQKIPEDGLTGKSDEENFGFTYAVLDRYIREGVCEDAEVKAKIDRLHNSSRHKLDKMPMFDFPERT